MVRGVKTLELGSLRVRAAGGDDGDGGGEGPAILLCHGFGAPGDDLVPLGRVIDAGRGVRWFFPEAPLSVDVGMGMRGRAWWNIDMVAIQMAIARGTRRLLAGETPAGMAEARAALEGAIAALEASHRVTRDKLVIGGFSQGAMLTTEIALHASAPFAGLAILSGTLVSETRWRAAATTSAPSLRAMMSHGRHDPILPFEGAEALRDLLTQSGAEVTWAPHNGQHEIPNVVLQKLGELARRVFA